MWLLANQSKTDVYPHIFQSSLLQIVHSETDFVYEIQLFLEKVIDIGGKLLGVVWIRYLCSSCPIKGRA